jgi:hypothetical protein
MANQWLEDAEVGVGEGWEVRVLNAGVGGLLSRGLASRSYFVLRELRVN